MKKHVLFFGFLFFYLNTFAQVKDSIKISENKIEKRFDKKKYILPASLITLGVLANNKNFKKNFRADVIQSAFGKDFSWKGDDYLQYMPIAIMYGADIFSTDRKNTTWDQTKYLLITELATGIVVTSLKKITQEDRPNGVQKSSFPSGHTAFSFAAATVLFNEYKDKNVWIAYSGYAFAVTTGVLRMANNKHWISDVLTGAGIGIGIAQLVYYLEPLKSWQPFSKNHVAILPSYDGENAGVSLSYHF